MTQRTRSCKERAAHSPTPIALLAYGASGFAERRGLLMPENRSHTRCTANVIGAIIGVCSTNPHLQACRARAQASARRSPLAAACGSSRMVVGSRRFDHTSACPVYAKQPTWEERCAIRRCEPRGDSLTALGSNDRRNEGRIEIGRNPLRLPPQCLRWQLPEQRTVGD